MIDEPLMLASALWLALAAFFVEKVFYSEGTRRPLSPGPFSPISRSGRLVLCAAVLVVVMRASQLLPRSVA